MVFLLGKFHGSFGCCGFGFGRFGSAGKLAKEFGIANSIDCRNENELLVGEMTNWRVQKVTLKPSRGD